MPAQARAYSEKAASLNGAAVCLLAASLKEKEGNEMTEPGESCTPVWRLWAPEIDALKLRAMTLCRRLNALPEEAKRSGRL